MACGRSRPFYLGAIAVWGVVGVYEGLRASALVTHLLVYNTAARQDEAAGQTLAVFVAVGVVLFALSLVARLALDSPGRTRSSALIVAATAALIAGHIVMRERIPVYRAELAAIAQFHLPSTFTVRFERVSEEDYYVVRRAWAARAETPVCQALAATIRAWGDAKPLVAPPFSGPHFECGWEARRNGLTMVAYGDTSPEAGILAAVSQRAVSACRGAALADACF